MLDLKSLELAEGHTRDADKGHIAESDITVWEGQGFALLPVPIGPDQEQTSPYLSRHFPKFGHNKSFLLQR